RLQAEVRNQLPLLRHEASETAKQDGDRRKVGKTTERESHDSLRALTGPGEHLVQVAECDDLVEDEFLTEERARGFGLCPGDTEEIHQRCENPAEDLLQRKPLRAEPAGNAANDAVEQRDQRDECD